MRSTMKNGGGHGGDVQPPLRLCDLST